VVFRGSFTKRVAPCNDDEACCYRAQQHLEWRVCRETHAYSNCSSARLGLLIRTPVVDDRPCAHISLYCWFGSWMPLTYAVKMRLVFMEQLQAGVVSPACATSCARVQGWHVQLLLMVSLTHCLIVSVSMMWAGCTWCWLQPLHVAQHLTILLLCLYWLTHTCILVHGL
jgi:hypothetical protein